MIGACRLNNKSMRNIRRNEIYQCLAIDLAMLGVISKEECEMLIGSGIPNNLLLPNGKPGELVSENNLPKQPDFIQTEPEQEPEVTTLDADTITTNSGEVSPVMPNANIVGAPGITTPDAGTITTDSGEVSPVEGNETPVDPVDVADGLTDQEPVNDEGRTESDN